MKKSIIYDGEEVDYKPEKKETVKELVDRVTTSEEKDPGLICVSVYLDGEPIKTFNNGKRNDLASEYIEIKIQPRALWRGDKV